MMNFETEEDIEYVLYSIDGEYSSNNRDIAFECVKKAAALNNKYLEKGLLTEQEILDLILLQLQLQQ
ncbi:MAG: hypothetical protein ACEQSR_13905 [Candidatus Methylacidiphilales bacterium]